MLVPDFLGVVYEDEGPVMWLDKDDDKLLWHASSDDYVSCVDIIEYAPVNIEMRFLHDATVCPTISDYDASYFCYDDYESTCVTLC